LVASTEAPPPVPAGDDEPHDISDEDFLISFLEVSEKSKEKSK